MKDIKYNWCKVSPRTRLTWSGGYVWSYPLTHRQAAVCPSATLIYDVTAWNRMEWKGIFDILTPFYASVWCHTHTLTETSNSPVWPSFAYGYLICHLDSNPGLQPHSIKPHRSTLLSSCTGVHIVSSSVCVYLCLSEWRASVNSWNASFNKSNDRRRAASLFEWAL